MLLKDFWVKAKELYEINIDGYDYIGIRFEDKSREIGDICECSKHNTDREDERDFPEFGTEEYDEMDELGGTSAWNLARAYTYDYPDYNADKEVTRCFFQTHCYIIASNNITNEDDGLDDGEIVIEDAKVVAILF